MNCDFSEKVSLLIDRELSPAETEQMRKHLLGCRACRQGEHDFLDLRHQIKSYEFDTDTTAQRQTLWKVLASRSVPLWRRKIALPAPVFAFVVIAVLAFGAWAAFARTAYREPRELDKRVSSLPGESQPNTEAGAVDLSRFDRGERAILYKERRSDSADSVDKGASQ